MAFDVDNGPEPIQIFKLVLAIAGIVLGILFVAGASAESDEGINPAGTLLIAVSLLVPSLWWLYCQNRDQQDLQRSSLSETLGYARSGPVDRTGFLHRPSPAARPRYWFTVLLLALTLFLIGLFVWPVTDDPTLALEALS